MWEARDLELASSSFLHCKDKKLPPLHPTFSLSTHMVFYSKLLLRLETRIYIVHV